LISSGVVPNAWLTTRFSRYDISSPTACRGTTYSASGRNASSRRMSRRVSPNFATNDRSSEPNELDSGGRVDRRMTFVAPSFSISRSAACLFPSPMETITITAATPRMMPREVSTLRSLCSRRLFRPRRTISRKKRMGEPQISGQGSGVRGQGSEDRRPRPSGRGQMRHRRL
jgi:hypothetical protein